MTASTLVATPDPVHCAQCGLEHVTHRGDPSCRGHKRNGKPCTNAPMQGQLVCRMHGGSSPQARRAGARRLALGEALAELDRLGRPVDVDPADAMLDMVREAAGNVAVYRQLVQTLGAEVDEWPGLIRKPDEGDEADDGELYRDLGKGIATRVDPANWKAAAHIWVVLYNDERERLVRWAKACRDAGVDERRVQLAEETGRRIVEVISTAVDALLDRIEVMVGQVLEAGAVLELRQQVVPELLRAAIEATGRETA